MYLISLKLSKDIKKALVPEYFIGGTYGQILLCISLPSSIKIQCHCHYRPFIAITSLHQLKTSAHHMLNQQTALSVTGTAVQGWQSSSSSLIV